MSTVLEIVEADESPVFAQRKCRHCSNSFLPRFEAEHFCCGGCRAVYELVHVSGFDTFYELLGRGTLQPAELTALPKGVESTLEEAIATAEENAAEQGDSAFLRLRVSNLSCTACVWLIDRLFQESEGAIKISMDTNRATLTLWWDPGCFDAIAFIRQLHRFGYPASPLEADDELPGESSSLVTRLGVTAGLAMNTMAFTLPTYLGMEANDALARLFAMVTFASATLALAVGGSYFFQRAWTAVKLRVLHMDIPISIGLAAAYLGSLIGLAFNIEGMIYFDFVAIFACIMLSGRWLHLRVLERNRLQLRARERNLTAVYRIDSEGEKVKVNLKDLEAWQVIEIPPGAIVPTAAQLAEGSARFRLDWINGEPDPVTFEAGQEIPAGARNEGVDSIQMITREPFAGSLLERLLQTDAQADSPDSPGTVDSAFSRILRYYLATVLLLAFAGGAAWLTFSRDIAIALQVTVSVLVVSCPCALGLALPLVDEIVASKLKSSGIFLKHNSLWSRLRRIRMIAFDKTGTLTEPERRLHNPEVLDTLSDEEIHALRCLTYANSHPVGKALREILTSRFGSGGTAPKATTSEESGKGISCVIDDDLWRLGRGDWATTSSESGACVLRRNDTLVARFDIRESVRDGAIEQLRQLRKSGYKLNLLSGDPDSERVSRTAHILGLQPEEVHCDLSPEEKAQRVTSEPDKSVLFIGDGGNDSLAFRAAEACGSPATGIRALEDQADFVFTGRGFHAIGLLHDTARRRRLFVTTIFTAAITYNLIAVGLCLAGMMNPLLAAILMPLSSIATTVIASRV